MGRTGGKFLYCVPSDCKSDGTQGIPVLHFQGCLSNSQGTTDGWQTDNLVAYSGGYPFSISGDIRSFLRRYPIFRSNRIRIPSG